MTRKTSRLVHYLSPVLCLNHFPWTPMVKGSMFTFHWKTSDSSWVLWNSFGWCKSAWKLEHQTRTLWIKNLTSSISEQINVVVSTTADAAIVAIATLHCCIEFVRRRSQHDFSSNAFWLTLESSSKLFHFFLFLRTRQHFTHCSGNRSCLSRNPFVGVFHFHRLLLMDLLLLLR